MLAPDPDPQRPAAGGSGAPGRGAVDRALRAATILAVVGLGAYGLAQPASVLRGGAAWLAFLCFALSGWGYLVARIARVADPDFGLRAAWGVAAYLAVAGALIAADACSRPAILGLLAIGAAGFAWRELAAPEASWHAVRGAVLAARARPAVALLAGALVLAALVQVLGAVAALDRNPWDDDLAYTPLVRRLLDTGGLVEPFSFRRLGAYGGQTALGALAAARGTLANVHLADGGLGFALALLLVAGHARERRCHPVWLALLALVLLLLPPTAINTASHWTAAALFLALYRTLAREHAGHAGHAGLAAIAGLVGAGACALRQNFIAVVVLFAGAVLLYRLADARRGRTWRGAWRLERARWAALGGAAVLAIAGWAIAAVRSSGTFLFPYIGGTWNQELSLRPEVGTWTATLADVAWACIETTPIAVVPVLAALLAVTGDDRPGRPLRAFFAAVAIGFLLLVHGFAGTDPFHLWRYAFGFAVALTAVFVVEVGAEQGRAARLPVLGRWLLLAALGLQLLVARQPVAERFGAIARDVREAAAIGRRGDPSAAVDRARYAAMQAAIPAGAAVAVMLDEPAYLDFARNRIANLDTVGYASPLAGAAGGRTQLPAFRGAEPMREYLVAAGYRYLAFVRSERSRYFFRRGFWLWRVFNDNDFFQIMSAYQLAAIEAFAELATTTAVLHDADGLVVLDLAAPRRPATALTGGAADERVRRSEWVRALAEREGLRAVWALGSRHDLRFEDGFGPLAFVEGELGDPAWFERSTGRAAEPPRKDEAATLRRPPIRPLHRRAHLRVRSADGGPMRLVLRAAVALETVHTRPRLDVSIDGELLVSAVADERGRYAIDVVVPARLLAGGWRDVYLVSSTIAEPDASSRELRVARVEALEWTPAR